ncbi:MAG: ATP-dependent sacrificial sulfur transferase LarE [Ardenticatenaceae bacterium]|nr:ATP-dependent sacrificial sulfur transferase LarE [Ardenticatenaceae bacterium]HBY95600.1 ATP-dependent sacrificial sulfur transferase LarE [Chloroflexota bacterium]
MGAPTNTARPLATPTRAKLERLQALIRSLGSALIAYSGGVDSALVMAVAHHELGERALACIGVSPSYPAREMRAAIELAERIGAHYRLVTPNEIENDNYAANPANRCYFCKHELHTELTALARTEGWAAVLDGINADDAAHDDRPGIRAAREQGVRSPLLEAGITKAEVREIARALNLPVWDKPAMACLSSRVPTGTPITRELLAQIEAAEDALYDLGLRQFRVRHHGPIARIEVLPEDMPLVVEHHARLNTRLREVGYTFVTLDLAGFKSGSLSQAQRQAPLVGLNEIPINGARVRS